MNRTYLTRAIASLPATHSMTQIPISVTENIGEALKGIFYGHTKDANSVCYTTAYYSIKVGKTAHTQGTAFTFETSGYKLDILTTPIPSIVNVYLNGTDMQSLGYPAQWVDIAINTLRALNAPTEVDKAVSTIMGNVATIMGIGQYHAKR